MRALLLLLWLMANGLWLALPSALRVPMRSPCVRILPFGSTFSRQTPCFQRRARNASRFPRLPWYFATLVCQIEERYRARSCAPPISLLTCVSYAFAMPFASVVQEWVARVLY